MRKLSFPLLQSNRAVSYTISAMIITATTITLVLVASIYAYQILGRQRGIAEFDVAKESIIAFNDALENIAWKQQAARSARFTIEYGHLELIPNINIKVNATINNSTSLQLYNSSTGSIRYNIENEYITFGSGYESYLIGNESMLITESTGSFGVAVIEQQTGWVTITLTYRVRAMRTQLVEIDGENVNYVDLWIIKLAISNQYSYVHDFDLKARCLRVQTISYGPYTVTQNGTSTITAKIGDTTSSASVPLTAGKVVFNVRVAEIQVSV